MIRLDTTLDGPAPRALIAGGGRPVFVPPTEAERGERPRDRIRDPAEALHRSIVGIDDSMGLPPGLVSRGERVLFPVACVSHEADGMVERLCEAGGKAFRPVRSVSRAGFVHAVMPAAAP